jgi:hypothetical protein
MTGHASDSGWNRSRNPAPDINMRVGDAERQQVADALSTHYSEGRLDAVEFNERMSQAMGAKTRADLSGLLTDLPSSAPAAVPPPKRARHRSRLLAMVLLAVIVAATVSSLVPTHLAWFHIPWLLIAVVALLFLRRSRFHRHLHRASIEGGPHRHRHW